MNLGIKWEPSSLILVSISLISLVPTSPLKLKVLRHFLWLEVYLVPRSPRKPLPADHSVVTGGLTANLPNQFYRFLALSNVDFNASRYDSPTRFGYLNMKSFRNVKCTSN